MFNETSHLSDLGALGYSGADTQWFALGYESREQWKALGRPLTPASGSGGGGVSTRMPGLPTGGTPTIDLPGGGPGGAPTDGAPSSGSGGGGFSLSSIPLWVWLIAGAFLLMKK